jgi:hypothetical protein
MNIISSIITAHLEYLSDEDLFTHIDVLDDFNRIMNTARFPDAWVAYRAKYKNNLLEREKFSLNDLEDALGIFEEHLISLEDDYEAFQRSDKTDDFLTWLKSKYA